jgi:hypothetical protein
MTIVQRTKNVAIRVGRQYEDAPANDQDVRVSFEAESVADLPITEVTLVSHSGGPGPKRVTLPVNALAQLAKYALHTEDVIRSENALIRERLEITERPIRNGHKAVVH